MISPTDSEDAFKTFIVSYGYEGARWALNLKARNFEDAMARVAVLGWGTVEGELQMTLPASTGPLAAIIIAVRNLFQSRNA